ncbi:energy-coupling factor ABC transporter ATP-binding protein [Rhizobium sp. SG2393]|uniref:energy-coupling factor ABC transporter ATP-binding protein n=1 Tax=Rhizobium sp. SG2393 TaxID=3276279 RepID=UPI00367343C1
MILQAINIGYAYPGGGVALDGASLSVGRGEKLALLGPNGAGKSTLFLTLNGTLKPDRGTILLDGAPVGTGRADLKRLRARVGLVLQDPDDQLFAATVVEDVSFGPMNLGLSTGEVRTRVDEALASLGITALAARPTHMLSFGQKKRVAIAGLIAMRPDVLLLDEPTAGLDPSGVEELMAVLSALAAAGTALVVATHDMEAAYGFADRVAVVSGRRVAREGRPEAVFADAALLAEAGLRPPIVYEIVERLKAAGVIPADAAPRDRADLLAMIGGGASA